jgi:hypothetical protein
LTEPSATILVLPAELFGRAALPPDVAAALDPART